jgi:hypothetical protein
VGRGGDRRAENEEVEYESNEEARESVAAGSVEVRARVCVNEAQFGAVGGRTRPRRLVGERL